ncbi:hypothetical protein BaRGS_00029034 [Batillaria attramentaria]|uniref:Uncharacterized protein n=1 Tax=Batillaria attramentaria TaxID=370345 RepID=A0ABD0JYY5_9CAEN
MDFQRCIRKPQVELTHGVAHGMGVQLHYYQLLLCVDSWSKQKTTPSQIDRYDRQAKWKSTEGGAFGASRTGEFAVADRRLVSRQLFARRCSAHTWKGHTGAFCWVAHLEC